MKKIISLALAIFLIGTTALWAEDSQDETVYDQAIGIFVLGNVSATDPNVCGIQYQQWFDKIGFQTEGFVYYNDKNFSQVSTYNFSLSGELLLKLYETPKFKRTYSTLYAWFMAGYHGYNKANYVDSKGTYGEAGYVEGYYTDSGFMGDAMLGIGFGFDIVVFDHISIPFQFGFEGEFPNTVTAGFCIGSGIRYRF